MITIFYLVILGKSRKGGVYKNNWIVPGGGIEGSETKYEAAKRETLEEVGLDISSFEVKLLDIVLTGESEKILNETGERILVKMTFYNFIVKVNKSASSINIICNSDIAKAKWYTIKNLSKLKLSPPTKTTLESLGYL